MPQPIHCRLIWVVMMDVLQENAERAAEGVLHLSILTKTTQTQNLSKLRMREGCGIMTSV